MIHGHGRFAAWLIALFGTGLFARFGPLDRPGARSLHRSATPTSGGIVLIVATVLGFALDVGPASHRTDIRSAAIAVAAASLIGLVGAVDDRWTLGARTRLVIGAALALGVALLTPPIMRLPLGGAWSLPLAPVVGLVGAALWLVTVANAVNFVDGANAVAPGAMTVAFFGLALGAMQVGDAPVATAALAATAACAGFLPWNALGRVFQGDAGALFCGLLFAALDLAACTRTAGLRLSIYFGPVALAPLLTEVLLTLLRRARGRRPLLEAHREHLYQRWLTATGRPHLALAWRGAVVMLGAGAAALALQAAPGALQPMMFAGVIAATSAAWFLVSQRLDRVRPRG